MWIKTVAAVAVLAALVIFADYRGWLGVSKTTQPAFRHLIFRFVDTETGAPISDVHIACTRPGVRSACTEKQGPKIGETTITFGAMRTVDVSMMFTREGEYVVGGDGIMHLSFVHPHYPRVVAELTDNGVISINRDRQTIKLERAEP